MRPLVILVCCLCWVPVAGAQVDTLWVDAQVEPAVVKLGEPFAVSVWVPAAPGDSLQGPTAPMTLGPVDLLRSGPAARGDTLGWRIQAAVFDLGDFTLPTIPYLLRGEENRWVMSRPFVVTVIPTAPDTAQALKGPKAPLPTPLRWEWFMVLGAIMALALLVGGVWFWRRNRLDPEPWIVRKPLEPADQEALKALRALEDEALPSRGLIQEHYYRLSAILRLYMERRFHFPAAEETTYEIAPQLERIPEISTEDRLLAMDVLDRADLAKFAKVEVQADTARGDLAQVRGWVERTTGEGGA